MPRDTAQTCAAPVAIRRPRGARALLTRLLDLQALWRQRRRLAELDDCDGPDLPLALGAACRAPAGSLEEDEWKAACSE